MRHHKDGKVYCERCDHVFESRAKFERHFERHSVSCEACPIDAVLSRIARLLRRSGD